MKSILTQIVDRLADTAASLDALELILVENGILTKDAIHNRFQAHKDTVDSHLVLLRGEIALLEN